MHAQCAKFDPLTTYVRDVFPFYKPGISVKVAIGQFLPNIAVFLENRWCYPIFE
jgi:hypothetical protein